MKLAEQLEILKAFPFLEAIRQFSNDIGKDKSLFVHLTLVPYLKSSEEIKTKPTQHSVKELRSLGIQPDIVVCRSEIPLPKGQRKKYLYFAMLTLKMLFKLWMLKQFMKHQLVFIKKNLIIRF